MDIIQLYEDYNIPTAPTGHKHSRPGWVNVECPFCVIEHPGYHLGATLNGEIFYCWKCGIHWPDESISKLLSITRYEANRLIKEYSGTSISQVVEKVKIQPTIQQLPSDILPLLPAHKSYLQNERNFDAEKIEKLWNLVSTGPVSILGKTNYGHRILAPIFWEKQRVTFQARDVTGKHPKKYLACPENYEIIKHKHIIYKHPNFHESTAICTEGITDVWRFGTSTVATFGIEYTNQQVRVLSQLYTRIGVCFDGNEITAQRQADKLISDLRFRKVDSFRIDITGDPGGLPQEEADYIVKQIIKTK
jgi:hypothetical protein